MRARLRLVAGLPMGVLLLLAAVSFAGAPASARADTYDIYIGGERTTEGPMDLGVTNPGTDVSGTLRVNNDGQTPLVISDFADITDGITIDAGDCTDAVAPGGSCEAVVTAHDLPLGARQDSFSIVSGDPGSPLVVRVQAGGQVPRLSVIESEDVAFGNVAVGATSDARQRIVVLDPSSTDLIATVSDISVIGTDADSFAFDPGTGCERISRYGRCLISITARPSHAGHLEATLRIRSDAINDPLDLSLSVTGRAGVLSADETTRDLGTLPLEVESGPFEIVWTNTGNVALTIGGARGSWDQDEARFDVANGCRNLTLGPGDSCSMSIRVTFHHSGPVETTFDLDSSASESDSVRVAARGANAGIHASKDELRFGTVKAGTGRDLDISLSSIGDDDLTGVTVALSGDDAFSIATNDCDGVTVVHFYPCDLSIRYSPSEVASHTAVLRVTSDLTDPIEIPLTGKGEIPKPVVSPTSIAFGQIHVGDYIDTDIWVDTRTVAFTVTDVSLDGAGFVIWHDGCADKLVGSSGCRITVRASPTSIGASSGHLVIETDAATTLRVSMTMTGASRKMTVAPTTLHLEAPIRGTDDAEVTVTNVSGAPLTMRGVAVSQEGGAVGSFTAVVNTCDHVELAPGGTCVVGLTFVGSHVGDLVGQLIVVSVYGRAAVALDAHVPDGPSHLTPGVPTIGTVSVRPLRVGTTVSAPWTARVAWTRRTPAGIDPSGTTYEVSVRKGSAAWKVAYSGHKTSADITIPQGDSEIRVRARNAGTTSDPRVVHAPRSVVDLRSASGQWTRIKDTGSLGGAVMRSHGSRSTVAVKGKMSGIAIVVRRSATAGAFDVYVDGAKMDRVTVGSGSTSRRLVTWRREFNSFLIHRVEVRMISGRVDLDGWLISH